MHAFANVVWTVLTLQVQLPSVALTKGAAVPDAGVAVGIDQIAEVAVPFDRLGLAVDEPLQFFVELLEGSQSHDRAPRQGTIALARPSRDFEQIMWDV